MKIITMLKKFTAALVFLAVMSGSSWGLDSSYNPYYLYPYYVDNDEWTSRVYSRYGNSDTGFLYQLRDITGAARTDQVAGPQWFATVYENYYYYFHNPGDTDHAGMYRRTMGGETPDVAFSVIGDMIDGFNFVNAEEPQPYESWMRRGLINTSYYDPYPDPVESLCVVITNGQGDFSVRFANPYARHFPFWWGWGVDTTANPNWWNYYDWREYGYVTADPINYIVSGTTIYERGTDRRYTEKYFYVVSQDASGDVAGRYITDTSGSTVYTISGDIDGLHQFYDTDSELAYTVSDDKVYNSSGNLAWTIETGDDDTLFICEVRTVNQSITFAGFDEDYTITPNATAEQAIASGNYLDANFRIRGSNTYDYGSTLGYITFRQRASFAAGYSNYREFTSIPMVIANVSNGNASDNPLIFDMIVFNDSGDIVNRIKFNWDAQQDMPTQDLGTFFMMQTYNSSMPTYTLETRITNNTGTRYELYRYDQYGSYLRNTSPDVVYRDNYASIRPAHWRYNLTQDLYGTLPDTFMLDAHSQIAPGLVTVYQSDVYGTINMNYDTSESFRLYEYSSTNPKNLRLNYTRVAGMTTAGPRLTLSGDLAGTQGFSMQFADVGQNDDETEYELTNLMGKAPAMVAAADSAVAPGNVYISSGALNAFTISKDVPPALEAVVSYDEVVSAEPEPEPDTPTASDDNQPVAPLSVSAATTYTTDKIALQPVSIRLRIPRQSQLLVNIWDYLEEASTTRELFSRFANYGTVWVRSKATREYDTNLFTAVNNRGSSVGASAADCVRAFLYNDELYLDFIVLIADAKSQREGRTAFIEVFKDDNVPYILIGDGQVDKRWELSFYVGAASSNPDTRNPDTPSTPTTSQDVTPQPESNSGGGGGGGCSLGLVGCLGLIVLALKLRKD